MNYLPIKLNKLRKHYSYSQQYVADKLGVDVVDYMNYENGNSMINYSQMKKLANLYHISMNQMFINSDEVELHEINNNTDELNARYFYNKNTIGSKIKGFIINHKIVTIIIGILLVAIIVLSISLNYVTKPYNIARENINRLSVSNSTVIYIEDSGAIGFSGSNSNGQLNNLTTNNAIKVCEGDSFSVVLNKDGTISSSGLIAKMEKELGSWKNIVDVDAGSNHIVGVDSNGRVYCVGSEEACGVAGTKNIKKVFATKNASIVLSEVGSLTYSGSFIGSSSLKDFYNIKDVASSENILVILNSDDTLNVYSKSGSYIKAETWTDIVDVTCGDDFVAALNQYGKVFIEIDNDKIAEKVNEWSNIIAIDAGSNYLIGFDGKKIYGVGANNYNQFIEEEKQKITLEKVKNIEYTLDQEKIYIQFDGVDNANGYLVEIDVGTGLSKRIEKLETVEFVTENMIEGKTYTISVTSVGAGDYKDSDEAMINFVYNKPEIKIDVNISDYLGKNKTEFENYLIGLDITFKGELDENTPCDINDDCVLSIEGLDDGSYSVDELSTKLVRYTYGKAVTSND